jgi:hypothetical protein
MRLLQSAGGAVLVFGDRLFLRMLLDHTVAGVEANMRVPQ